MMTRRMARPETGASLVRGRSLGAVALGAMVFASLPSVAAHAEEAPDSAAVTTASAAHTPAADQNAYMQFDASLLMGSAKSQVDLARFARANMPEARTYNSDIFVNGEWIGREDVRFDTVDDGIRYCIDPRLVARFNIDITGLDPLAQGLLDQAGTGRCVPLPVIVPGADALFDLGALRLDITIPQAAQLSQARGYVAPESWDAGVNSATLAYRGNFYHSGGGQGANSGYLGVTAGLNLNGWYVRHQSAATLNPGGDTRYQNIATYVQRHIAGIQSQLTIGDSFTDGMVLDTIGIRGVQLASEDQMLPESQRGYAPLVRGTARTNARVTVAQNGVTLYETTVAPGPFIIRDIYATGFGANLDVTVTEADGAVSRFSVPYAAAPQLVRKGRLRYSVAGGWLRDEYLHKEPPVLLATAQYGLSNLVTLYGGVTASQGYKSALLGGAINTKIGSFSADMTVSNAQLPGLGSQNGHRLRLAYSAFISPTDTNIAVAAYMRTSRDYWDIRAAAHARDQRGGAEEFGPSQRERSRFQITVNQNLGDIGRLYLSGLATRYWNRSGTTITAQAGYGKSFRIGGNSLMFNVDYSQVRAVAQGRTDNRLFASLSIPLGGGGVNRPTLTASVTEGSRGNSSQQLRVHGTALDNYALSYGAFAERQGGRERAGANVQYRGRAATLSASGSVGDGSEQYSLGVSGGIVIHPGGVTLANDLGETIGIVEAKGAGGAQVLNGTGLKLDKRGYAIIPYLSPYRLNSVAIDPQGISADVQFRNTAQQVAPVADAAVMIRFATRSGRSALIKIREDDGSFAGFGSILINEKGEEKGVVGQGGQAFVSGVEAEGKLYLASASGNRRCAFDYKIPPADGAAYPLLAADCKLPVMVNRGVTDQNAGGGGRGKL